MALLPALTLLLSARRRHSRPRRCGTSGPRGASWRRAPPACGTAELGERLRALAAAHPGALSLESVGRSVEGRQIQLLTLGRGPRRVLLWSQMHGDEPSATPALLDLADYLLSSDGGGARG